jgi:hypothetical protein
MDSKYYLVSLHPENPEDCNNEERFRFYAQSKSEGRIHTKGKTLEETVNAIKILHLGKIKHDLGRELTEEEIKAEIEKIRFDWNNSPIKNMAIENKNYVAEILDGRNIPLAVWYAKQITKEYIPEFILEPVEYKADEAEGFGG